MLTELADGLGLRDAPLEKVLSFSSVRPKKWFLRFASPITPIDKSKLSWLQLLEKT